MRPFRSLWGRLSVLEKVVLPLAAVTIMLAVVFGGLLISIARDEISALHPSVELRDRVMGRLTRDVIIVAGIAVLVEVATLGALIYGLVRRRLRRLTEAAARVAAGDLSVRLGGSGDPGRDGLDKLAHQFDEMARVVETRTRELQEAEERYRRLVEELPAATYVWSVDEGRVLYHSPQVESMLGYPVEEWLEDPLLWNRILHPVDRERIEAVFQRGKSTGDPIDEEYRLVARDGSVRWIHERAVVVPDNATGKKLLHGVMYDVTERMRMEEALRESDEKYRSFVETTKEWVWAVDQDARITYSNPAVRDILGYPPEELLGWNSLDLIHEEDRQEAIAVLPGIVEEGRGWTEWVIRWRHRNGTYRYLESNATPIIGPTGEVEGFRGSDRDITDRVTAEKELRDNIELLRRTTRQRQLLLARLQDAQERERQRIAEDIHDDSLQVMTAVGLRLDALRLSAADPGHREGLERLAETVRQCIRRLRHLLFELRPTALDRHGLAAGLQVYLEELSAETGLEVDLDDRLPGEPPEGIRTTLYRIAQEALTNVRKHAQARRVDLLLEPRDGGVFVRVRDDGRGFGTPVEPVSGPGHLGLSAMRERAEMADGWWRVSSTPDTGTTVEFWLPLGHHPAAAEA